MRSAATVLGGIVEHYGVIEHGLVRYVPDQLVSSLVSGARPWRCTVRPRLHCGTI